MWITARSSILKDLVLWAYKEGVKLQFSRPGKPTDNAMIESFNRSYRNECLQTHWFRSQLIAKYERPEASLDRDIALLFLSGFSTRAVAMVSKALLGTAISPTELARVTAELVGAIEQWRVRDLSTFDVKYLIVNGVQFPMRTGHSIEHTPMLVVLGVLRGTNRKVFLRIQQGTQDSASVWREVFKDLKARELNPETIELGIMDGLSGLERVFTEEFPKAKIQRSTRFLRRNGSACEPPMR